MKEELSVELMSLRLKNRLKEAGIYKIGDLSKITRNEFLKRKNVGRKTLYELANLINDNHSRQIDDIFKPEKPPYPKPINPRNVDIFNLRNEGKTFKAISNVFGISVTRVRQIYHRVKYRTTHRS